MNDGGSAFPCMPPQDTAEGSAVGYPYPTAGMTLRDYFAAKAITAAAADELLHPAYDAASYKGTAERAYLYADAMLKARQS